jgi:ABC-2 type transport system permease protein
VLAGLALLLAFAFGFSWIWTTLGLLLRSPSAVLNLGMVVLFPLTFMSNVFVEPSTMPAWLRTIVDANPISHLVTAERGLMAGTASAGQIAYVLAAAALVAVVFAPLTMRLYGRGG